MLRHKVLLQLLLVMLITLGLFGGSYYYVIDSYERLELENLLLNSHRVINALEHEIEHHDEVNWEWASEGLVYSLIQDPNLINFRDIVIEVITGSFNVREAAIFSDSGELLVARVVNPLRDGQDQPLGPTDDFIQAIAANERLLQHVDGNSFSRGLININGATHIISSRPILEHQDSQDSGGTLVMLGNFDASALAELMDTVQQQVELIPVTDFHTREENIPILELLHGSEDNTVFVPVSNQQMDIYTLVPDINSEYNFVIRIVSDRDFVQQATRTMLATGLGVLLLFLLLIGFFLVFLDKSILRRLQGLSNTVSQLADNQFSQRLEVSGNDEISAFGKAFNQVLDSQQASQRILTYQATHDALTGLFNRHQFEKELELAIVSARSGMHDHHLLFIDLDRFKVINDTCGHMAGDSVLREIAGLMKAQLRSDDILGRIGGDEFGVILRNCRTGSALTVAENLRKAITSFHFQFDGRNFSFGASIGLLSLSVPEALSCAAALTIADSACRVAKQSGRNRIHVHQSSDAHLTLHLQQTNWVNRITEALQDDRFVLYGQRIYRLSDSNGEYAGREILLRLKAEDGSIIDPGSFVPTADRYGLMNQIDKWVIENFCSWYSQDGAALEEVAFYAINLSGQSLSDLEFPDYLSKVLSASTVPKQKLCFEITETAAIENLSNTSLLIETLKREGCRFALDDFGAGMSSFSYLKHLPVDMLKIDGAFCRNMHQNEADRAIVKSINEIGHVLGLQTIAEYVENAQSLEVARSLGIDYAQGFYLHPPELLHDPTGVGARLHNTMEMEINGSKLTRPPRPPEVAG